MGLTIHWKLKFSGSADDALSLIKQMWEEAMDMSFEEVSDVAHFIGQECDFEPMRGKDNPWFWSLIQAQQFVKVAENTSVGVKPDEVILFRTWPGEGCEEANFGLCRYPESIKCDGKIIPTALGGGWNWRSFCKTQYANTNGIFHFLRCHTLVVAMLDCAKELGILQDVSDEGDYWEKRSLKELVEEVGRWDAFIAGFSEMLEGAVGKANLYSAIEEHPRYEQLKEIGMQHLDEKGLGQLRELFDTIKRTI